MAWSHGWGEKGEWGGGGIGRATRIGLPAVEHLSDGWASGQASPDEGKVKVLASHWSPAPPSRTQALGSKSVTQSGMSDCWQISCQDPQSMGSPGKNNGMGHHSLLQEIFLETRVRMQGSNSGLLNCRQILYRLSHQENSGKAMNFADFQVREQRQLHFSSGSFCFIPHISLRGLSAGCTFNHQFCLFWTVGFCLLALGLTNNSGRALLFAPSSQRIGGRKALDTTE